MPSAPETKVEPSWQMEATPPGLRTHRVVCSEQHPADWLQPRVEMRVPLPLLPSVSPMAEENPPVMLPLRALRPRRLRPERPQIPE